MGQDSYLSLKKSRQSVIDQNLPYRFIRGHPLNFVVGQQSVNKKKSPDCSKHLSFYWWTQFASDEKAIFAK